MECWNSQPARRNGPLPKPSPPLPSLSSTFIAKVFLNAMRVGKKKKTKRRGATLSVSFIIVKTKKIESDFSRSIIGVGGRMGLEEGTISKLVVCRCVMRRSSRDWVLYRSAHNRTHRQDRDYYVIFIFIFIFYFF